MIQSKYPWRSDYVKPWWYKVADFIPDWIAVLMWILILGVFAFMIGGQLHEIFCGCK